MDLLFEKYNTIGAIPSIFTGSKVNERQKFLETFFSRLI